MGLETLPDSSLLLSTEGFLDGSALLLALRLLALLKSRLRAELSREPDLLEKELEEDGGMLSDLPSEKNRRSAGSFLENLKCLGRTGFLVRLEAAGAAGKGNWSGEGGGGEGVAW